MSGGSTWTDTYHPILRSYIPDVSERPSSMQPDNPSPLERLFRPKYYTEYNNRTNKIILHISAWRRYNLPGILLESQSTDYSLMSVSYTITGFKFKKESKNADTNNISISNHIASLTSNELLQVSTGRGLDFEENWTEELKNNILEDYKNGVSGGTVDIFCGDYYNAYGIKIIDWSVGQIIKPYDIVYFDNDLKPDKTQRYWRVVGREFSYNGSPKLHLELQEIVKIYQNS